MVEAKIESLIMCRGVYAHLIAYEQVCWKKTDKPDQSNAIRQTLFKARNAPMWFRKIISHCIYLYSLFLF